MDKVWVLIWKYVPVRTSVHSTLEGATARVHHRSVCSTVKRMDHLLYQVVSDAGMTEGYIIHMDVET